MSPRHALLRSLAFAVAASALAGPDLSGLDILDSLQPSRLPPWPAATPTPAPVSPPRPAATATLRDTAPTVRVLATPRVRAAAAPPTVEPSPLGHALRRFYGHHDAVQDLAVRPQGDWLASASEDGTAWLWSLEDGAVRARLPSPGGPAEDVTFSPDGDTLAIVGHRAGSGVFLWDLAPSPPALRRHLPVGGGLDNNAAFSPDGKWLATPRFADAAVFDVATGEQLAKLEAGKHHLVRVAFSPDGSRLATGDREGRVDLWRTADWSHEAHHLVPELEGLRRSRLETLDFSEDGSRLLVQSSNFGGVLELAGGRWTVHREWKGKALAFLAGEGVVASAPWGGKVQLIDAERGHVLLEAEGHRESVESLLALADGRLLSGSEDGTVVLWQLAPAAELQAATGVGDPAARLALAFLESLPPLGQEAEELAHVDFTDHPVTRVGSFGPRHAVFHPTGAWVAAGESGKVVVRAAASDDEVLAVKRHARDGEGQAFSPDGARLAYLDAKALVLVEVDGWREARRAEDAKRWLDGVAYSPDGAYLVTTQGGGVVQLHDPSSGALLRSFQALSPPKEGAIIPWERRVHALAFPDAPGSLVTGGSDGKLRLWDLATGQRRATLEGHEHEVLAAVGGGEAGGVVSAGADRLVRWWQLGGEAPRLVRSEAGHAQAITSLAVHPGGRLLASGGRDGRVLFWDLRDGRKLLAVTTALKRVDSLTFSPDGSQLRLSRRLGGYAIYPVEPLGRWLGSTLGD